MVDEEKDFAANKEWLYQKLFDNMMSFDMILELTKEIFKRCCENV